MADIETRLGTVERELAALKARVDANEDDMRNIPELIKIEFRLNNSQMARLTRDVAALDDRMGGMDERLRNVEHKLEALPRVIAEIMREVIREARTG